MRCVRVCLVWLGILTASVAFGAGTGGGSGGGGGGSTFLYLYNGAFAIRRTTCAPDTTATLSSLVAYEILDSGGASLTGMVDLSPFIAPSSNRILTIALPGPGLYRVRGRFASGATSSSCNGEFVLGATDTEAVAAMLTPVF